MWQLLNFLHVRAEMGSCHCYFCYHCYPNSLRRHISLREIEAATLYFSVVKFIFAFSVPKRRDQVLTIHFPCKYLFEPDLSSEWLYPPWKKVIALFCLSGRQLPCNPISLECSWKPENKQKKVSWIVNVTSTGAEFLKI